jgi:hypothetical protein
MLKRQTTLMILMAAASFGQGGLQSLIDDNGQGPERASRPPKIEPTLRQKASNMGTLRVFLALSEQLERGRVDAIKQAHSAQIRGLDEATRSIRGTDRMAADFRRIAVKKRDEAITAERREIAEYARATYAGTQALVESRILAMGERCWKSSPSRT